MHTLIIETQAETDYQLLLGLAHRLGLRVSEQAPQQSGSDDSQQRQFSDLFGAWQSDETGDELARKLRQARYDTSRLVVINRVKSKVKTCM